MKTKVQFEVKYNSVSQTSEFMSKLNLGIEKIEKPEINIIEYTTTTKVTQIYIQKMKIEIRKVYKSQGFEINSIKYIKKENKK